MMVIFVVILMMYDDGDDDGDNDEHGDDVDGDDDGYDDNQFTVQTHASGKQIMSKSMST